MNCSIPARLSLLLLLASALPAYAGIYTYAHVCAQAGPWGSDCTTADNAVDMSRSFSNPGGADQLFHGTASVTATPETWKLSTSVDYQDYRRDNYVWTWYPDDNAWMIRTTAYANAAITDSITASGGTGVYSLNYIFSIDGSLTATSPGLFSNQFCAMLSIPTGTETQTSYCISQGSTVPSTFTLSYADLPFGGPVQPTLSMFLATLLMPVFPDDIPSMGADTVTASAAANFGSTIHLQSVLVTDSSGHPIPGVSLESGSGFEYPLDPANSVPEPAGLLPVGLAVLLLVKRFRG